MKRLAVGFGLIVACGLGLGCEIGVEQPAAPVAKQQPEQEPPVRAARQPSAPPRRELEVVTRPRVVRGQLEFVEGYSRGYAQASSQAKPMMLFFTAAWCGYCRQMAADAFTHPQVVQLSDRFVCVLVDADQEPDVCRQFAVSGYPTIQFVSPRGSTLNRLVGKQPGGHLIQAMQAALARVARHEPAGEAAER